MLKHVCYPGQISKQINTIRTNQMLYTSVFSVI